MATVVVCFLFCFFFQAEDGIRDLVRSRGLGDVYKRQVEQRRVFQSAPARSRMAVVQDHRTFLAGGMAKKLSLIHI